MLRTCMSSTFPNAPALSVGDTIPRRTLFLTEHIRAPTPDSHPHHAGRSHVDEGIKVTGGFHHAEEREATHEPRMRSQTTDETPTKAPNAKQDTRGHSRTCGWAPHDNMDIKVSGRFHHADESAPHRRETLRTHERTGVARTSAKEPARPTEAPPPPQEALHQHDREHHQRGAHQHASRLRRLLAGEMAPTQYIPASFLPFTTTGAAYSTRHSTPTTHAQRIPQPSDFLDSTRGATERPVALSYMGVTSHVGVREHLHPPTHQPRYNDRQAATSIYTTTTTSRPLLSATTMLHHAMHEYLYMAPPRHYNPRDQVNYATKETTQAHLRREALTPARHDDTTERSHEADAAHTEFTRALGTQTDHAAQTAEQGPRQTQQKANARHAPDTPTTTQAYRRRNSRRARARLVVDVFSGDARQKRSIMWP